MLAHQKANVAAGEVERFARLRSIFGLVLDADPSTRREIMDRECEGDGILRAAVQELVDATNDGGTVLDPERGVVVRALLADAQESTTLEQVGPYHILRVLGQGGMGTVYLAEQDEPCRRVAIKVLRSRFDAGASSLRFSREVRALARLDHRGIASIFDAGTARTERGPVRYFAMQLVDGPPITKYCEENRLGLRDRLHLIAQVADAVQHAHSHGVIHRDLKPGNVLVDDGRALTAHDAAEAEYETKKVSGATTDCPCTLQVKVLDFGVARLLDGDEGETQMTETCELLGTIAYMSPEQFEGTAGGLDARTDVYSLGVMLYELLVGRVPHEVRGKPLAEAARIVRFEEPTPIRAIRSATARDRPDRDMETIVQKAIAKDREQRYATAAALADDIRRYLAHEPIAARPATAMYQITRFARRHRGLAAGLALAVVFLGTGLIASTSMYVRAERERGYAEAEQRAAEEQRDRADAGEATSAALQGYLIEDVLKSAAPDQLGKDARLVDVLLDARSKVGRRFTDQPDEQARVRAALADIFVALGMLEEADEERTEVVAVLERTHDRNDERVIAALVEQAKVRAERKRLRIAEGIAEDALARARSSFPEGHDLILRALRCLAGVHFNMAHYQRAISENREALAIAKQTPTLHRVEIVQSLGGLLTAEGRLHNEEAAATWRLLLEEQLNTLPEDQVASERALGALLGDSLRHDRVEDAARYADLLIQRVDWESAPQHVAPVADRVTRAYLRSGQYDKAEQFGLRCHKAYLTAFPNGTRLLEPSAELLVSVYKAWPGHDDELYAWSLRWISYRCVYVKELRSESVAERAQKVAEQLAHSSHSSSPGELLEAVWNIRTEIVPSGHPKEATFRANFATAATQLGRDDLARITEQQAR